MFDGSATDGHGFGQQIEPLLHGLNGTLTASEDVVAAGISLKSHKHGGLQPGGVQSGTPV